MARVLLNSLSSHVRHRTQRLARLWKVVRTDTTEFHFTDHSQSIDFSGDTYLPAGWGNPSAQRKEVGLEDQDRNVRGYISSSALTTDDLRAGRYRRAIVTEYLIDWQHPWAGAITTNLYFVTRTSWDGESWELEMEGLASRLKHRVGDVYGRVCRWQFGDSNCQFNLFSERIVQAPVAEVDTDEPRRIFSINESTAEANEAASNDYYRLGKVSFVDGANANLVGEVQTSSINGSYLQLELQLPMPYDVGVDVKVDLEPGCNKLSGYSDSAGDCVNRWNNLVNFGGFPTIPGTDKVLKTPPAQ